MDFMERKAKKKFVSDNLLALQRGSTVGKFANLRKYWSPSSQASVLWLESIMLWDFLKGRSTVHFSNENRIQFTWEKSIETLFRVPQIELCIQVMEDQRIATKEQQYIANSN